MQREKEKESERKRNENVVCGSEKYFITLGYQCPLRSGSTSSHKNSLRILIPEKENSLKGWNF